MTAAARIELLTEQEAADALRLSARTLRKARQAGQLNFFQHGSSIRYAPADLAQFIERNRVCPSTAAKAPRSGNTRSRSTVFDFEEARAARARKRRN